MCVIICFLPLVEKGADFVKLLFGMIQHCWSFTVRNLVPVLFSSNCSDVNNCLKKSYNTILTSTLLQSEQ